MGAKTKIEWAQMTWNPVRGCTPVSPGCKNCYAARMAARGLPGHKSPTTGEPFAILTQSGPRWTGKVELIESMLDWPLRRKKPLRIFVNSMSDLFHEGLSDDAIDRIFAVMALCQRHTFLVLTKRADRMREYFGSESYDAQELFYRWGATAGDYLYRGLNDRMIHKFIDAAHSSDYAEWIGWPLPNLHMGVSVENRAALSRIDHLRETPAAVRFLSCEPLLEDLGRLDLTGIHQVIVGGESGPGARPMHPDWVRSIRDQCVAAGVAFFFKQWGEWQNGSSLEGDRRDLIVLNDGRTTKSPFTMLAETQNRWGDFRATVMARVGKHKAGRLLDGREWNEMPNAGGERTV